MKGVRTMTVERAIEHAEEVATEQEILMGRYDAASGYARSRNESIRTESAKECEKCAGEHRQLAAWLRELQERRKAPEIVRCGACIHFQCNMRFDGSVPKGADAYECRRGCGGCDPMDYCCYGERAERRTDGEKQSD